MTALSAPVNPGVAIDRLVQHLEDSLVRNDDDGGTLHRDACNLRAATHRAIGKITRLRGYVRLRRGAQN